jgi:hypothetical protein
MEPNSLKSDISTKDIFYRDQYDQNDQDKDIEAINNLEINNTISELHDFSYELYSKLKDRITSTGIPIGNNLSSHALFEFNNFVLIKYATKK